MMRIMSKVWPRDTKQTNAVAKMVPADCLAQRRVAPDLQPAETTMPKVR